MKTAFAAVIARVMGQRKAGNRERERERGSYCFDCSENRKKAAEEDTADLGT